MDYMRFHALRHYCASQLHALGMPDAYIMERGGWESDGVLKGIYRHTLSDYAERVIGQNVLNRVGESLQWRLSSSHTTVRTVRYTAVHKFSATFKYWESMDG